MDGAGDRTWGRCCSKPQCGVICRHPHCRQRHCVLPPAPHHWVQSNRRTPRYRKAETKPRFEWIYLSDL